MCQLLGRLFGRFTLQAGDQPIQGFNAAKIQELLCYLLIYRTRSFHREAIAALLWNDTPEACSKKSLRQALWKMQSALDRSASCLVKALISVEGEWLQFNNEIDLWVDLAEFEQACQAVEGVRGRDLDQAQVEAVKAAVSLYRGELLEGWYQDWCLFERERCQGMVLHLLDKLMDYCEARGEYEAGLAYGQKTLAQDRAREYTHRQMMRLLALGGDRTGALRQYGQCVQVLKEELGVAPARQTSDLYHEIYEDRFPRAEAGLIPEAPDRPPGSLGEILSSLQQMQAEIHKILRTMQNSK